MKYFVLKDAEKNAVAALSTEEITSVILEENILKIKYTNLLDEVYTNVSNVANMPDFFNKLSGENFVGGCDEVFKQFGGCNKAVAADATMIDGVRKYHRYHAVFYANSANVLSIDNLQTLYVTPTHLVYSNTQENIVNSIQYQTYGDLFEKLKDTESFYVIDDVIAIYVYGINDLKLALTEDGMYTLSVRYNDQSSYITHSLNIDDDRAIHLLNTLTRL